MKSELTLENGTWALRPEGSWRKLLLSDATVSRLVKSTDAEVAVVSSVSNNGLTNSITIENQSATLSSGTTTTQNNAAYWGFPLKRSDGVPITLAEAWSIDLFLEWTATPGKTDNNKCLLAMGINDGNVSWANGKMGGYVTWNHASGPKAGGITQGGGTALVNSYESLYFRCSMSTAASGENGVIISQVIDSYDSSNARINHKSQGGTALYAGSPGSRPTDDAYVWIAAGATALPGGTKNFSFNAFYRVHYLTYNGISTHRPGT